MHGGEDGSSERKMQQQAMGRYFREMERHLKSDGTRNTHVSGNPLHASTKVDHSPGMMFGWQKDESFRARVDASVNVSGTHCSSIPWKFVHHISINQPLILSLDVASRHSIITPDPVELILHLLVVKQSST